MIFLKHKHDNSPLDITGAGMLPLGKSPSPFVWHLSPWQLKPADLSACIVHLLLASTHTHITHISAHTFIHTTHKNTHSHIIAQLKTVTHTTHSTLSCTHSTHTFPHSQLPQGAHTTRSHTHIFSHTPVPHTSVTYLPHTLQTHATQYTYTSHYTLHIHGPHTLAHHIHMLAHMC